MRLFTEKEREFEMNKEAKERILQVGDREIKLVCPICGGEQFFKKEARVDTSMFTEIWDKFVYYYACSDCGHIIWMEKNAEKAAKPVTSVGVWEQKLQMWGYGDSEMALRKVLADDNYHEDAHTAARNLLKKLR